MQSVDSQIVQRNLQIVQIPRLRGTYVYMYNHVQNWNSLLIVLFVAERML